MQAALTIIEHYAPGVEGPLYYIPQEIDDLAAERQEATLTRSEETPCDTQR